MTVWYLFIVILIIAFAMIFGTLAVSRNESKWEEGENQKKNRKKSIVFQRMILAIKKKIGCPKCGESRFRICGFTSSSKGISPDFSCSSCGFILGSKPRTKKGHSSWHRIKTMRRMF
jgi:hypothetical protein